MYLLKKMIEKAKTDFRTEGRGDFMAIVPDIKPFVFSQTNRNPEYIPDSAVNEDPDLDLPFPVISIEIDGGLLTVASKENGETSDGDVACLVVQEIAPKEYKYYIYAIVGADNFVVRMENKVNGFIVEQFLKRLKNESVGVVKENNRIKIKRKGKKIIHKIRDYILVAPKRDREEAGETRNVEWSHSFWVRGHWRNFDGIGKDRDGNRRIKGFTWIRHHIKGDGILVEKTRRVV